jgi:hypothetical protein
MYPSKTREMTYQNIEIGMYWVHTGTYYFMTLKYVPGTYFFLKYILKNKQLRLVWTWYISVHTRGKKYVPNTYFGLKVCTEYILREKVWTRYIQVYVRLSQYNTIAWYIPVCTVTGTMNSVHTTVHDSRWVRDCQFWFKQCAFALVAYARQPLFKLNLRKPNPPALFLVPVVVARVACRLRVREPETTPTFDLQPALGLQSIKGLTGILSTRCPLIFQSPVASNRP